MQYFPLFVDTSQLKVLLIGAGEVASRKLDLLVRTEADIYVIASDISAEVQAYADKGRVSLFHRAAKDDDIQGVDLVYLATADQVLNTQLANVAKNRGIWVNVVDSPKLCRFITPSIVDRGRLQVAISTAGAAPVFARELRSRLESWLPGSLTELFDFVADRREEVQQKLPAFKQRKLFWEHFFRTNGDQFNAQTQINYDNAYQNIATGGEILLLDDETQVSMLPIAAMPLLQRLDHIFSIEALPFELNELVRRDASRAPLAPLSELSSLFEQGKRCLIFTDTVKLAQLKAHFPMAKHLKAGSL